MKYLVGKAFMGLQEVQGKVRNFLKEEKSLKEYSNEGFLTYAGIVIGVIALFIIIGFLTLGFNTIGDFFQDGITGKVTNPPGWGGGK